MVSRRHFMAQAGAWSALLATGQSAAQTATDYKALVCIFLAGGNDAFNTLLATDAASWSAYQAVRNQAPSSIALLPPGVAADPGKAVGSPEWLGGVLPLTPSQAVAGRTLALHPRLTRLQALFNTDRRLAVVANVGPLVQPLTKEQYQRGTAKVPAKLFSHNDQQNTWQSLSPEGSTQGWGGKLMDSWVPRDQSPGLFGAISVAGNAVWLSGQRTRQYQLSVNGAIPLGGSTVYGSTAVGSALQRIAANGLNVATGAGTPRNSHVLMADLGGIARRSMAAESQVTAALAGMPVTDPKVGPDSRLRYTNLDGASVVNPLARQLQAVARMIAGRSALGVGRQVFFVQLAGFDTHDNQNKAHAELMARLDHAMGYFDQVLQDLSVRSAVTTFTASDFGRTFTSNGDGTDHGWGGHHFVMGGAVRGGRLYGTMPVFGAKNAQNNQFDASPDQLANGVLLPSTSVDQYGATLASWFGATNTASVFPNLSNFASANLGFI
jgi:uncharacterized protein (DUF1501 family)